MPVSLKRIFITGASSLVGQQVVAELSQMGLEVWALTRSVRHQRLLSKLGAKVVFGDLSHCENIFYRHENDPGWQWRLAMCDGVIHLAQPKAPTFRITKASILRYEIEKRRMDENLFNMNRGQRLVYVASTSYYGHQGSHFRDEGCIPDPKGLGHALVSPVSQAHAFAQKGRPIIMAFPGKVYGLGAAFEDNLLTPIKRGKDIVHILGSAKRYCSLISAQDCGRALIHLLFHGRPHNRYFLVDDNPLTKLSLLKLTAEAVKTKLSLRRVPAPVARLLMGGANVETSLAGARLANWRLKSTGFEFHHPTAYGGIPHVIKSVPIT